MSKRTGNDDASPAAQTALPRRVLHDFNNLFMGIIGCVDVVVANLGETPQRRYFDEIRKAALRGTDLAARCLGQRPEEPALEAAPRQPLEQAAPRVAIIVEGDPLVRLTIQRHLATLGIELVEAATAKKVAELLAAGQAADLVIADARVAADLGKLGELPPVLYVSAHSSNWLEEHGHISAGSATLRTPIDRDALLARVRDLLPFGSGK